MVSQRGVNISPVPAFDLDEEYNVQQAVSKLIANDLVQSAHDCSEGGLFVSLLESAMVKNLGFNIRKSNKSIRNDAFLFGEAQSRIVISVTALNQSKVEDILKSEGIAYENLGIVTSGIITVDTHKFGSITDFATLHQTALEKHLA